MVPFFRCMNETWEAKKAKRARWDVQILHQIHASKLPTPASQVVAEFAGPRAGHAMPTSATMTVTSQNLTSAYQEIERLTQENASLKLLAAAQAQELLALRASREMADQSLLRVTAELVASERSAAPFERELCSPATTAPSSRRTMRTFRSPEPSGAIVDGVSMQKMLFPSPAMIRPPSDFGCDLSQCDAWPTPVYGTTTPIDRLRRQSRYSSAGDKWLEWSQRDSSLQLQALRSRSPRELQGCLPLLSSRARTSKEEPWEDDEGTEDAAGWQALADLLASEELEHSPTAVHTLDLHNCVTAAS